MGGLVQRVTVTVVAAAGSDVRRLDAEHGHEADELGALHTRVGRVVPVEDRGRVLGEVAGDAVEVALAADRDEGSGR